MLDQVALRDLGADFLHHRMLFELQIIDDIFAQDDLSGAPIEAEAGAAVAGAGEVDHGQA